MELKVKRIRVKAWTDAARGEECLVQVPGICNFNPDTVVAAHGNRRVHGKGLGRKADDLFIAFACSACHDVYDKRVTSDMPTDFIEQCWIAGHARTLRRLYHLGLLREGSS